MVKYIGIRGHRGAGKNTISYLLGVTIEYYVKNKHFNNFDFVYKQAIENIRNNPDMLEDLGSAAEFRNVYFDSFADTAKITLAQILGINSDWLYNDWMKDSVIIDLRDFSAHCAKDKIDLALMESECHPWTAKALKEFVDEGRMDFTQAHYITLRELIVYYSKYVMQSYFGANVWVKSLENGMWEKEQPFADSKTYYRIFVDCKFPTEISYILNKKGKIVKVNRDSNIKENTSMSEELANDNRFDFEIDLDGDLDNLDLMYKLQSITYNIINND